MRKSKVAIYNHHVDGTFCVWADVFSVDLQAKESVLWWYMTSDVLTDTRCHTKQHKTDSKPKSILSSETCDKYSIVCLRMSLTHCAQSHSVSPDWFPIKQRKKKHQHVLFLWDWYFGCSFCYSFNVYCISCCFQSMYDVVSMGCHGPGHRPFPGRTTTRVAGQWWWYTPHQTCPT